MSQDRRLPAGDEFDRRLRQARDKSRQGEAGDTGAMPPGGLGQAIRMAAEMVAALVLGAIVGSLLDSWLGTQPWLLIVFLFIGIASGTLNAYRAARRLGAGPGPGPAD